MQDCWSAGVWLQAYPVDGPHESIVQALLSSQLAGQVGGGGGGGIGQPAGSEHVPAEQTSASPRHAPATQRSLTVQVSPSLQDCWSAGVWLQAYPVDGPHESIVQALLSSQLAGQVGGGGGGGIGQPAGSEHVPAEQTSASPARTGNATIIDRAGEPVVAGLLVCGGVAAGVPRRWPARIDRAGIVVITAGRTGWWRRRRAVIQPLAELRPVFGSTRRHGNQDTNRSQASSNAIRTRVRHARALHDPFITSKYPPAQAVSADAFGVCIFWRSARVIPRRVIWKVLAGTTPIVETTARKPRPSPAVDGDGLAVEVKDLSRRGIRAAAMGAVVAPVTKQFWSGDVPPLDLLRESMIARPPPTLRYQRSGALALVGVAKSTDLASGDAQNLGSLHTLETPLEHSANDLEAIDFLRAHRHQLLGQHARESSPIAPIISAAAASKRSSLAGGIALSAGASLLGWRSAGRRW